MSAGDQNFSVNLSRNVINAFVPLCELSEEQYIFLAESSELVNLFAGQDLVKLGDTQASHLYLVHGCLILEDISGHKREVASTDIEARLPISHLFPRRTKVSASSDAQVLKVPSELLEKILCWGQVARCLLAEVAKDADYEEDYLWIKRLFQSRLFYKVPPTNILDILNSFIACEVKAGEKIIQEGDEGSCCYLIKAGEADVLLADKGDKPVVTLSIGSVFGDDALVSNKPRNASVIMKTNGVLMKLEKQSFYELLKQPAVTTVTPANVEGLIIQGAKLIDVRTQAEFDNGHHEHAMNLPLHLSYLKSALLDGNTQYIAYSGAEERAKTGAFLLVQQGFNVYVMQGGIETLPLGLHQKFTGVN